MAGAAAAFAFFRGVRDFAGPLLGAEPPRAEAELCAADASGLFCVFSDRLGAISSNFPFAVMRAASMRVFLRWPLYGFG